MIGAGRKTVVTPGMNVLSRSVRYELIDENTGRHPKGLKVKRKGNTLELEVDGEKVIELDDFIDSDAVLDVTTPNGEMISLDETLRAGPRKWVLMSSTGRQNMTLPSWRGQSGH